MKEKLLSGRYLLTVIGGIGFLWCMYSKLLTAEAITSILTMIFISYFQRADRKNGGGA